MCWLTAAGCGLAGPQVPAQASEGPCPALEIPHVGKITCQSCSRNSCMAACRQRWQRGCTHARMCWPQWLPPSQPSLCAGSQVILPKYLKNRPNLDGGAFAEALRMKQIFIQVDFERGALLLCSAAVPEEILLVSCRRDDPAPQLPPVLRGMHNPWSSPALVAPSEANLIILYDE